MTFGVRAWTARIAYVGLMAALLASACAPAPVPKAPILIGVIQGISPDLAKPRMDALRAGLEALGYREGREIAFDVRYLEGQGDDRAAQLTQELIQRGAAIIVTGNPAGVAGARRASPTIPIVMAGVSPDPVADGFVASVARPGGNVTGLSLQVPTLPARRLQVLKQMVPDVSRIGVLHDATAPNSVQVTLEQAASVTGLALDVAIVRNTVEIDAAFASWRAVGIRAAHVNVAAVVGANFKQVAAAAIGQKVATSFSVPDGVREGGLFSIGTDQIDLYRRSAVYVDKILKGASPGDLPVGRPERFDLVINMRTAQAIGVTIPDSVLSQATELIR